MVSHCSVTSYHHVRTIGKILRETISFNDATSRAPAAPHVVCLHELKFLFLYMFEFTQKLWNKSKQIRADTADEY